MYKWDFRKLFFKNHFIYHKKEKFDINLYQVIIYQYIFSKHCIIFFQKKEIYRLFRISSKVYYWVRVSLNFLIIQEIFIKLLKLL